MASQHGKDRCCRLAFRLGLGLQLTNAEGIDTDRLGTFCGEIERAGPPATVVLEKARLALGGLAANDLALASEASFGPHPVCPWVAGHQEYLTLLDGRSGLYWTESKVTQETNFAQEEVRDKYQQAQFLGRIGFPLSAVMAKPAGEPWIKGLQSWDKLPETFPQLLATDMRAHLNPARRQVIRRLSLELVRRMRRLCPKCLHPGYGVTGQRRGLPCETCRCPTAWIAQEIWECLACGQKATEMRRDGITEAPASDCLVCNP